MYKYFHNIQYYETDKMGIVHHSNYLRFFEEARIHYLKKIGLPYEKIEKNGIISPIVEIHCKYIKPCQFGDKICIQTSLEKYNGFLFVAKYQIFNAKNKELLVVAESKSCFVNQELKPINLKHNYSKIHEKLQKAFLQENANKNSQFLG